MGRYGHKLSKMWVQVRTTNPAVMEPAEENEIVVAETDDIFILGDVLAAIIRERIEDDEE